MSSDAKSRCDSSPETFTANSLHFSKSPLLLVLLFFVWPLRLLPFWLCLYLIGRLLNTAFLSPLFPWEWIWKKRSRRTSGSRCQSLQPLQLLPLFLFFTSVSSFLLCNQLEHLSSHQATWKQTYQHDCLAPREYIFTHSFIFFSLSMSKWQEAEVAVVQ